MSEETNSNADVAYAVWRFFAWCDNQGSYIEIDEKVQRGALKPQLPYVSPDEMNGSGGEPRTCTVKPARAAGEEPGGDE